MASEIKDKRWAMGLGIWAGRALLQTEHALNGIQATAVGSDFQTIASLRAARLELNHLAKHISRLIDELEKPQDRTSGR